MPGHLIVRTLSFITGPAGAQKAEGCAMKLEVSELTPSQRRQLLDFAKEQLGATRYYDLVGQYGGEEEVLEIILAMLDRNREAYASKQSEKSQQLEAINPFAWLVTFLAAIIEVLGPGGVVVVLVICAIVGGISYGVYIVTPNDNTQSVHPAPLPIPTGSPTPIASPTPVESSPITSFSEFYRDWKGKNVPALKTTLSKSYIDELTKVANQNNLTLDEMLNIFLSNGPSSEAAVPETRNEKVEGDKATLEVKNEKMNSWVRVPLVKEDNQWKLAIDEATRKPSEINGILLSTPTLAQSYIRLQHWIILQGWLAKSVEFHLATADDFVNQRVLDEAKKKRGKSFHPYYIVQDFNGDHKEDFAVALIDESKYQTNFAVAIFNGPFNIKRSYTPTFFQGGIDMSERCFFFGFGDPPVRSLGFGPCAGNDNFSYLEPAGNGYTLRSSLDALGTGAEPSQTGQLSEQASPNTAQITESTVNVRLRLVTQRATPDYLPLSEIEVTLIAGEQKFKKKTDATGLVTFDRVRCGAIVITSSEFVLQNRKTWQLSRPLPCGESEVDLGMFSDLKGEQVP